MSFTELVRGEAGLHSAPACLWQYILAGVRAPQEGESGALRDLSSVGVSTSPYLTRCGCGALARRKGRVAWEPINRPLQFASAGVKSGSKFYFRITSSVRFGTRSIFLAVLPAKQFRGHGEGRNWRNPGESTKPLAKQGKQRAIVLLKPDSESLCLSASAWAKTIFKSKKVHIL